jgi:hypothetical protein
MDNSQLMTAAIAAVTGGGGAAVTIQFLREKINRHSDSLKAAFKAIDELRAEGVAKHEQQQKHIHALEVQIARLTK